MLHQLSVHSNLPGASKISNQVKKGPKGNLRGNAQGEVAAQAVVVRDKGARISTTCKQKIHSWGKAVRPEVCGLP